MSKKLLAGFSACLLMAAGACDKGLVGSHSGVSKKAAETSSDPVVQCLNDIRLNRLGKNTGSPNNQIPGPIFSHRISSEQLPIQCGSGRMSEIRNALRNQILHCRKLSFKARSHSFRFGCKMFTLQDFCLNANKRMLKIADRKGITYPEFLREAATSFDWYQSDGRNDDLGNIKKGFTQFTAYYNPTGIDASSVKTPDYRFPLYAAPAGLTHISNRVPANCGYDPVTQEPVKWCIKSGNTYSPLPSRDEINKGAMKLTVLAYLRDELDVDFLMLEGSGALNLHSPDGAVKEVIMDFNGTNGHPNNLLGNVMRCQGKPASDYSGEMAIRQYFKQHPSELYQDTNVYNPSIIFFKPATTYVGTEDIPITPNASIATDPRVIPTGTVTLYSVPSSTSNDCGNTSSTMAIAQDVGGAIKGAHVDRYMGEGTQAQMRANSANDPGLIFMAIPKGAGRLIPNCIL